MTLNYNARMRALRWLYLVALAVWLGGLVLVLAFGAIVEGLHLVAYGAGATLLVSLAMMALVGPRPRPWAPRLALVSAMLAASVVVHIPLGRAIDARRADADWLHRASTALLLLNVAGGLVLLAWETRT